MDLPPLDADADASVRRARAIAVERGAEHPDLTDILLGLLDAGPTAGRVLELFEADPDLVRMATALLARGPTWLADPEIEEANMDLARTEAARLGHDKAGSEHLLLALLRQSNSIPGGILASLGLTLDSAREAVRYIHGQVPDWERPEVFQSGLPVTAMAAMEAMPIEPDDPAYEQAARLFEASMSSMDISLSALDRVIGIGQTQEDSGILVEMIAVEIRHAGAILHWRTRTAEDRMVGEARVTIADDIGTPYAAFPGGWSGGGPASSGETLIAPRPPIAARTLSIEVNSFGDDDTVPAFAMMRLERVVGSWLFEVPLDT